VLLRKSIVIIFLGVNQCFICKQQGYCLPVTSKTNHILIDIELRRAIELIVQE